MAPTFGNGKICYIVIPATDVSVSAEFYRSVFGWSTRMRGDGSVSFDDGVGEVSGTWATGLQPIPADTLSVHVMVDDAAATLDLVVAHGGEIVRPVRKDAPEITALFRDPAGNVLGIYQHRAAGKQSV